MSESEPLFALLELMLRTFTNNVPKMKAGGHPEEMFLDLTEDERDEIECSICYQILRDVRQCENKHKFCYSCIFVWSTSGNPVNHSRCPVCRVEGLYVRNNRLDETINSKRVKCSMKSCKWTGALTNLPSHQHTTYTDERSTQSTDNIRPTELPSVATASTPVTSRPHSESRSVSRLSAIQANNQTTVTANPESQTRRLPLAPTNTNTQNTARSSSTSRSINNPSTTRSTNNQRTNRSTNAQSTNRTRTRSRNRQNNSTSPQRRSNITATGLNSRLTSRARIQNTGAIENRSNTTTSENRPNNVTSSAVPTTSRINHSTADENQNPVTEQTTTEAIHVPHPPSVPRTEGPARRRLPTLPNMLTTRNIEPLDTDNNNNLSSTSTVNTETESPRTFTITASVRRPGQPRSFGTIRDRLNESRQRLDMLMSVFSTELDRGRQDITSFQEERERRRQEQLAEVQNLGRRLTQVAQELRGLLSQRRQIRGQMDTLIQSASDDPD